MGKKSRKAFWRYGGRRPFSKERIQEEKKKVALKKVLLAKNPFKPKVTAALKLSGHKLKIAQSLIGADFSVTKEALDRLRRYPDQTKWVTLLVIPKKRYELPNLAHVLVRKTEIRPTFIERLHDECFQLEFRQRYRVTFESIENLHKFRDRLKGDIRFHKIEQVPHPDPREASYCMEQSKWVRLVGISAITERRHIRDRVRNVAGVHIEDEHIYLLQLGADSKSRNSVFMREALIECASNEDARQLVSKLRLHQVRTQKRWIEMTRNAKGSTKYLEFSNIKPNVTEQDFRNFIKRQTIEHLQARPAITNFKAATETTCGYVHVECYSEMDAERVGESMNQKYLKGKEVSVAWVPSGGDPCSKCKKMGHDIRKCAEAEEGEWLPKKLTGRRNPKLKRLYERMDKKNDLKRLALIAESQRFDPGNPNKKRRKESKNHKKWLRSLVRGDPNKKQVQGKPRRKPKRVWTEQEIKRKLLDFEY